MILVGIVRQSLLSPMSVTASPSDSDVQRDDLPAWQRECAKEAQAIAADILDTLRGDHRYCSHCFRKIRTVEVQEKSKHKERHLADATEHSDGGTVEDRRLVTIPGDLDAPPGTDAAETTREWRSVGTRLGLQCECGMGHHSRRRRPVKKHEGVQIVRNLSQAIDELRAEFATGSKAEYAKIDEWAHDEDALANSYQRLKSNAEGDGQDPDVIERALAHRFLAQRL